MSVVVKGMKMPENCKECPFSDHEAWCLIPGNWRERYYCPDDYVSEHCPLVDLGKHGRLVDVTTAYQDTMLYSNRYRESVLKIIDAFTTVIEAEDGE